METITFENDITLLCVTASSFPEGIMDAHKKLHAIVPFSPNRKYYGLSRPENNGGIIYKAAVTEIPEDATAKEQLEAITLKAGWYISLTIHDYMKDMQAIGNAFQQLIANPDIDPEGYCVEDYVSQKDVRCMVRLKS
jgi:predicted transcriptional regulator YdeE